MQDPAEKALLEEIARGGPAAWDAFLSSSAQVVFRVARLFADTYDGRMDLFLFACERLKEDDMRRLKSFRHRPGAPCRFSTWLAVVVRNIALDFVRSKEGRFRPFRSVEGLDPTDRLVFDYHLRDGRPLSEVGDILSSTHGIRLSPPELSDSAARVQSALSASQRWRLIARLAESRSPASVDPVGDVALESDGAVALKGSSCDPERALRSREADRALQRAVETLPPRMRLALTLRFRDGMSASGTAEFLGISKAEAERLTRQGIRELQEMLRRSGVAQPDLEGAGLASIWSAREQVRR